MGRGSRQRFNKLFVGSHLDPLGGALVTDLAMDRPAAGRSTQFSAGDRLRRQCEKGQAPDSVG